MCVSVYKGLRSATLAAILIAVVSVIANYARADDFFPSMFDMHSGRPTQGQQPSLGYNHPYHFQFPPQQAAPVVSPRQAASPQRPASPRKAARPRSSRRAPTNAAPSVTYCVRTCDGRYFPLPDGDEQDYTASCNKLCPASDTSIFRGSSIARARSEDGKSYTSLPNAFRYREQLVGGCTCKDKDPVGLASIAIVDDKTIRKGDIVAGEGGLMIATRAAEGKRGRIVRFSPAPSRVRAKFEGAHAMMRK